MSRAFPLSAVILIILLVTGSPVQAAPVRFTDVTQVINGLQNPADLRLNSIHSESTALTGVYDQTQSGKKGAADGSTAKSDTSILPGVAAGAPGGQSRVEVVTQGEVDGTVCDCGEIWEPGGFPKWPLLFLAGIPLFFIHGDEDLPPLPPVNPPPPESNPTPTPTPTPEPASLLLLGTGLAALGAGMRRRYTRSKLSAQSQTTEETEVS